MLRIFVPPTSLRSGNDVIGNRTAIALSNAGMPAVSRDLWPDLLATILERGNIPGSKRIFRRLVAPISARYVLSQATAGDVFWVLGSAAPGSCSPNLELAVRKRGARYIYHIMDDWFSQPYLREGTIARCRIADLIVVPTPELLDRVKEHAPNASVVRLEEPIDTDRVHPLPSPSGAVLPLVVWCGNPGQFGRLARICGLLNDLQKRISFRFRVVSGRRPELPLQFPWEWLCYNPLRESEQLAGAAAGLAPLENTTYTRCKGAYKIKTYMAAGIPAIASPVGFQTRLVENGVTGFLAGSDQEWTDSLSALISDPALAARLGISSRERASLEFSHAAVAPSWVKALQNYSSP